MKDVELEKWRAAYRENLEELDLDRADEDVLIDILSSDTPTDSQLKILERHLDNPRSLQIMQTALALKREIRKPSGRNPLTWLAVAASVLLMIAGAWLFIGEGLHSVPGFEDFRGDGQLRDVQDDWVPVPPHEAVLEAPPAELQVGMDGDDTASYRFSILTQQGETLWQSPQVEHPFCPLPPEVRQKLSQGSYLWTMEVIKIEGRRQIGPFGFSVQ